jgi:hypothetical protein
MVHQWRLVDGSNIVYRCDLCKLFGYIDRDCPEGQFRIVPAAKVECQVETARTIMEA